MRREVKRIVGVKAGKTIEITCKLPKGLSFSKAAIFSSENGGEFSPYIPNIEEKLSMPSVGKDANEPRMFSPLYVRITGEGNQKTMKILAQKNMEFAIMQETDLLSDPTLIVKVKIDEKTTEKIGRLLRNVIWRICGNHEKRIAIK